MFHTENPNIKQFFPLVTESLSKGMTALSDGDNSYGASTIEIYAQNIFSRAYEIDNALKNISITMEYLRQKTYEDSKFSFSEIHAHHIENFLLRLTSVIDRSYLLAGSTLLIPDTEIEKLGGNRKISKELLKISPESAAILDRMRNTIDNLRIPRNKVAHQAGFSSNNLCVLKAVENSEIESVSAKKITDIMSYDKIKEVVSDQSIEQYQLILSEIDILVTELIDSLSSIYTNLLKKGVPTKT